MGNDTQSEYRFVDDEFCVQSAIRTVTLGVTSKVAASVTHPARIRTCLTLKPTRVTVCGLLHCTLLASDETNGEVLSSILPQLCRFFVNENPFVTFRKPRKMCAFLVFIYIKFKQRP